MFYLFIYFLHFYFIYFLFLMCNSVLVNVQGGHVDVQGWGSHTNMLQQNYAW